MCVLYWCRFVEKSSLAFQSIVSLLVLTTAALFCVALLETQIVSRNQFSFHISQINNNWACIGALQGLNTNDQVLIVSILNAILSWLCLFYLLCDYGEDMTQAFRALSISFFDDTWPLYPIELQKLLIIMIQGSQEAVYLKGHASINTSRDIFKQVNAISCRVLLVKFRNELEEISCFLLVFLRLSTLDSHTLWCFADSTNEQFIFTRISYVFTY